MSINTKIQKSQRKNDRKAAKIVIALACKEELYTIAHKYMHMHSQIYISAHVHIYIAIYRKRSLEIEPQRSHASLNCRC